jgi:hypothetical protein
MALNNKYIQQGYGLTGNRYKLDSTGDTASQINEVHELYWTSCAENFIKHFCTTKPKQSPEVSIAS